MGAADGDREEVDIPLLSGNHVASAVGAWLLEVHHDEVVFHVVHDLAQLAHEELVHVVVRVAATLGLLAWPGRAGRVLLTAALLAVLTLFLMQLVQLRLHLSRPVVT